MHTLVWLGSHISAIVKLNTRPVTSLGHQKGRRVFWGAQICWTMSNSLTASSTFFQGGEKNFLLRACWTPSRKIIVFFPILHSDSACDTLPVRNSVHARDLPSCTTNSRSNSSHPQRDRRRPEWMRDYRVHPISPEPNHFILPSFSFCSALLCVEPTWSNSAYLGSWLALKKKGCWGLHVHMTSW